MKLKKYTLGNRHAARVASKDVLKSSVLSTLNLITRSSPRPIVNTNSSVTLAALLLITPAV